VVDTGKQIRMRRIREKIEVVVINSVARRIGSHEVNQRAVRRARRWYPALSRTGLLPPFGAQQCIGTGDGPGSVAHPKRHGTDRGAVKLEVFRC